MQGPQLKYSQTHRDTQKMKAVNCIKSQTTKPFDHFLETNQARDQLYSGIFSEDTGLGFHFCQLLSRKLIPEVPSSLAFSHSHKISPMEK